MTLFVFRELNNSPWFKALVKLKSYKDSKKKAIKAYAELFAALSETNTPDLVTALARELFWIDSSLARNSMFKRSISDNLKQAILYDLKRLCQLVNYPWHKKLEKSFSQNLPVLEGLSSEASNSPLTQNIADLRQALLKENYQQAFKVLQSTYQQHGTGELAQYLAFRYLEGELVGIKHPPKNGFEGLLELERQIELLSNNTKAFLGGKSALHTLLYGERGSGKSTAVRSLLTPYATKGLRLIEIAPAMLKGLSEIVERLRHHPHRYILFVDDLNFEADDKSYQPLKSLLEGSLIEPAKNVLLYATSNRRHLVKERHSDRPDPLDDDVHAWDTFNERLALSDRFGLTITFPTTNQKRYLAIVRGLAMQEGLVFEDLEQRALHFAQWGNGYTGRTARQFIDHLHGTQPFIL